MKKLLSIIIFLLFSLFLYTNNIYSEEERTLTIDFSKMKYRFEMPFMYYEAFNYLSDNNYLLSYDGTNNNSIYDMTKYENKYDEIILDRNGKPLVGFKNNQEQGMLSYYELLDNVNENDNIEISIRENDEAYQMLDKIIVKFGEYEESDKEEIVVDMSSYNAYLKNGEIEDVIELFFNKQIITIENNSDSSILKNNQGKILAIMSLGERYEMTIPNDVTEDDNIVYTLTDEEKSLFSSLPGYQNVETIKMIFVSEDEYSIPDTGVFVKEVKLIDKNNNTRVLKRAKFKELDVSFNIEFSELQDYIKYDIVLQNKDNEDYKVEVSNSDKNDFIDYKIEYDDKVLKANSETTVHVIMNYKTEVPSNLFSDGIYNEVSNLKVDLKDDNGILDIINPKTGVNQYTLLIIIALFVISVLLFKMSDKKSIKMVIIIGFMIITVPTLINALKEIRLNINVNVRIQESYANLIKGQDVNNKIRSLGNGINVTSIKRSNTLKGGLTNSNIISTDDSMYPVYMWVDGEILYYYSDAKIIYMNENSSYMFDSLDKLNDISGLSDFNSSKVKDMSYMFSVSRNGGLV